MNSMPFESAESVLLISCYELGHQPSGISMPLAFLKRAGLSATVIDLSVEEFDPEKAKRARFAGISVPMHTALRLGVEVARQIRQLNPSAHICFYGLYASLNSAYLLDDVADSIIGGEFEASLVAAVRAVLDAEPFRVAGVTTKKQASPPVLSRLEFVTPDRQSLPQLKAYAKLEHLGELKLTGYVEASRGCLHHCTHCPIPPVYGGRFFAIERDVVMTSIRELVAEGAAHITFGDPDFLNGPTHALRLTRDMHREFPELTFDFTAKIEHIIKHRELIPEFGALGCIFVVSAIESLSNEVLRYLEKGHTRADVDEALRVLSLAGIALRPSFVAFTPWTTLDDYIDVLDWVERNQLIDHVDPVQYSIRLLVPPGSLLLANSETARPFGPLDRERFTYNWSHPDPRMDTLQQEVSGLVERAAVSNEDAVDTFFRIRDLAFGARGEKAGPRPLKIAAGFRLKPPRLTESWFCCAEPMRDQFRPVVNRSDTPLRSSE